MAGRIDTHHHVMHDFWLDIEAQHSPGAGAVAPPWHAKDALALMDDTHCQTAILSVSAPGVHFGDDAQARELARRVNEASAALTREHPGRFGFFASLPIPDVDGALEETRYALDDLHADGVILLANTHGQYLGDTALDPLMEELNEREAVVFVHPNALPSKPADGIPPFLADFLLDTVRAAINMVRHDIPRRYPKLKIILSHGGGFLPYIPARLAHTMGVIGSDAAQQEQFRSFWFDTALTPSPSSLPSLLEFADHSRLLYGSDYPYATTDTAKGFAHSLDSYDMPSELRAAIDRENALKLFPRFA